TASYCVPRGSSSPLHCQPPPRCRPRLSTKETSSFRRHWRFRWHRAIPTKIRTLGRRNRRRSGLHSIRVRRHLHPYRRPQSETTFAEKGGSHLLWLPGTPQASSNCHPPTNSSRSLRRNSHTRVQAENTTAKQACPTPRPDRLYRIPNNLIPT